MSERGSFRGGARGGQGGGNVPRGRGRGGAQGGAAAAAAAPGGVEKPKKENILDLTKYMDKEICVKFAGGREGEQDFCPSQFQCGRHGRLILSTRHHSHGNIKRLRSAHEPSPGRRARIASR